MQLFWDIPVSCKQTLVPISRRTVRLSHTRMSLRRVSTSRSRRSGRTILPASSDSHLEELSPERVERPDEVAEEEGLEPEETPVGPSTPETQKTPSKPKLIAPFDFRMVALIMPMSIFGLLARLGLQALATYPGQSIFALAWVQAAGCFVMGALLGLREPISLL